MRYRWLLFDADGTLFDYEQAESRALELTLARVGFAMREDTRERYHRVNAALWKQLEAGSVDSATLRYRRFEQLFAELGLPVEAAHDAGDHYLVELSNCSQLLPGAEALLREFAPHCRLAIITNGLADVQRPRLARSSIADLFETVTISDELGIAKPDPRIIDHTLAAMDDPPRDRALIIGDSLSSDIQGGVNAGIGTCWFAPNGDQPPANPRPDHVIRSLDELPAIVATA